MSKIMRCRDIHLSWGANQPRPTLTESLWHRVCPQHDIRHTLSTGRSYKATIISTTTDKGKKE